jgi:hypothetical protein
VEYREQYPHWVPCDINDAPGRTTELILTKSSDWSYEKEYRLIGIRTPPSSSFLQLHGDFFRLPNGALKSIIIGTFVKQCAPELPIKRAVSSPDLYKLEIVDDLPG